MGRSCHASVAFVFLFYLLNTAAVNSLTVCHPCRPILSAQTGALLKKEKTKRTQNFFFTPSKWSARCLSLRYFLWLKAFSSYRSCPFFRGTAAVAHCVIVKTTHLRCWLQLWWAQACAQMLCRQGGGGKKSGHAFTMQDNTTGFLTYGCTVRRCDLQAEYKSQVEQPHRHLLSNARWHRC